MNKKPLLNSVILLLFAGLLQACAPAGRQNPAEVVGMQFLSEVSAGGQTASAHPEHTLLLVAFEVPDCQGITTFFFGADPEGYIVNKDFSEMILKDVFCNKVEAVKLVDAAGAAYPPVGFLDGKRVIFEVPLSAENLVVRLDADILLPLIGDPNLGNVEPSIKVPYCDDAIASGQIKDGNYLCMSSEAGDYVGAGRNWLFTAEDSSFNTIGTGTTTIFVNDGDWVVEFSPAHETEGKPGLYEDAVRTMTAQMEGKNGVDVTGDGRGCNAITGRFEVLDMRWRADNVMTRLYVNFEQHCEGKEPALYGYLRFDAEP